MPQLAAKPIHHRARRLVKDTWQAQANLSFFLAVLVSFVFVLPLTPLVEDHFRFYMDFAYSILLISGIAIGWGLGWLFYLSAVVGVAGLAVRWLCWLLPALGSLREALTFAALLLLIVVLLARVFSKEQVSGSRIQGAISVYLMLGLGWAHAYGILSRHHPHAFAAAAAPATPAAWTYFSFTTLTTLGYGDIVPVAPVARTLAMGEAFTGQLYLAVLVARLVALQVAGSGSGEEKKD